MKNLKINPANRFVVSFLLLFVAFYYFTIFFEGLAAPGNLYVPFLDKYLNYIKWLRDGLLITSEWVLNVLGYATSRTDYVLRIPGRGGIKLVYSCLGFGVMSFFAAFVISYPVAWRRKIIFLIAGLVGIQTLNIARFCLLTLYWKTASIAQSIDHHTIFNIIIYAAIILALYLWTAKNKFGTDEANTA